MKRVPFSATWSSDTQHVYHHDQTEWWDRARMPHRYRAYRHSVAMLLAIVRRLRAQTVLNVGCAQATLDLLMAERGLAVTAVDIRPGFLEYARLRYERGCIRWIEGDFLQLSISGGPFDLVMSHHVIEHVAKPGQFVERLAQYTRPGGHVLITTPNHSYMRNPLPTLAGAGELSRYPGFVNSCDGHEHVYALTRGELCALGRAAGLSIKKHFYYESFLLAGHIQLHRLHRYLPDWSVCALEPLAGVPGIGPALFQHHGMLFQRL